MELLRVICVSFAVLDQLDCQFIELIEIVGCVRKLVSMNLQKLEILKNSLLELTLEIGE